MATKKPDRRKKNIDKDKANNITRRDVLMHDDDKDAIFNYARKKLRARRKLLDLIE